MWRILFLFCLFLNVSYAGPTKLNTPTETVILVVAGEVQHHNVANEAHFDKAMLAQLPAHTLYTTTLVTDGIKRFDGVLVRDLLDALVINKEATQVEASALNDYVVKIPITDFYNYDVLMATHMDGVELALSDKGPLWIVYPRDDQRVLQDIRYDYRWVWQLNHLQVH